MVLRVEESNSKIELIGAMDLAPSYRYGNQLGLDPGKGTLSPNTKSSRPNSLKGDSRAGYC